MGWGCRVMVALSMNVVCRLLNFGRVATIQAQPTPLNRVILYIEENKEGEYKQ